MAVIINLTSGNKNITLSKVERPINVSKVTRQISLTHVGGRGAQGEPGATGETGPANSLSIGTVTTGSPSAATITGDAPSQTLNLTLEQGESGTDGTNGTDGAAATVAVGTTSTLAPGSSATVTNSGSSSVATLNFGIPQGARWYEGSGAPSTTHNNGDFYLNTTNGDVYEQVSGAWGSSIANLTGPTGSAGSASGSDTQVQFNDGGSFAGDSGLTYNKTTNALTVSGDIAGSNLSGTNTGDQTTITGNAGTATALATARTFQTNLASTSAVSFDGSANNSHGVTGNLPVTHGGTGRATSTTAYGLIAAGTTATATQQTISPGTSGAFLKSAGASALASFASITESDVTNLTSDLAAKAPLASPTLTGTPVAPTAISGTNTTQIATTAFVAAALSAMNADNTYGWL